MSLGQSEHAYYLSYFTKVDESVGAPQRGTNIGAEVLLLIGEFIPRVAHKH